MSVAPAESAQSRSSIGRHRRVVLLGTALLLLVALVASVVVSWFVSSQVLVPDRSPLSFNVKVEGVSPGLITLTRSAESARPGIYGLDWKGGHAIVEGMVRSSGSTVTRTLRLEKGRLAPGTQVAIDSSVYEGDPSQTLGLKFSNVVATDELGPMPAWLIPSKGTTWAIVVHGINGNRDDDLRIAPALHRAGLTTLLITYREDVGAPASPDGKHHMGLTEWRDLQAAARYALAHGARRLVLVGDSMGGAIVAQFMEHSPLTSRVAGLVLDAPALDWKAILSFGASELGLPSFVVDPVEWMIGQRITVNWNSLDTLLHPADFHVPTLLFHGESDKLVPISTSDAFARELKGWVTYYRVPDAGHTEAWNVGPALYDKRVYAFLARLH
jgi:hypothetical protein